MVIVPNNLTADGDMLGDGHCDTLGNTEGDINRALLRLLHGDLEGKIMKISSTGWEKMKAMG